MIPPVLYACKDLAGARLLISMPFGLCPITDDKIQWKYGDVSSAVLNWCDPVPWVAGDISIAEFDAAWPEHDTYNPGPQDLIEEVVRLSLSYKEAIRRIQK